MKTDRAVVEIARIVTDRSEITNGLLWIVCVAPAVGPQLMNAERFEKARDEALAAGLIHVVRPGGKTSGPVYAPGDGKG